jgi:tetratricopeptide (TPR) repeat protein
VLQQEPDNAHAWYLLGALCEARGELAEAAGSQDQALRVKPDFADALHHRGIVCLRQNQSAEAAARFRSALQFKPADADIQTNLALALLRQAETEQLDEAVALLQVVLQQRPSHAPAQAYLSEALSLRATAEGAYYLGKGKLNLAGARFREALHHGADIPYVHHQLGHVLAQEGKREEAITHYQQAARLQPDFSQAHCDLAQVLHELGRFEEALAHYAQALQAKPDPAILGPSAAFILLLLMRKQEKGWPEYSWSWPSPYCPAQRGPQPRWDGSPQVGKTILLHADGCDIGDTLQFVRYARRVQEQGATVVVACEKPLVRLLGSCSGIDQLVARSNPLPPHDFGAPLNSLPYLFRTQPDSIPGEVPYLGADPKLVEQWRRELAVVPGFKVGIAWQGDESADKLGWSVPLPEFAPLAAVPGVRLVSLQKGVGSDQVARMAGRWPLTDLGSRLDEATGALMDTAAVMKHLDLVVTADTAVAHLAGALGVPVCVLLPHVADWRWFLGQDNCPWYPTMRLFRQERQGEWGPVLQRLMQEVKQLMERRKGSQDSSRSATTCPAAGSAPLATGLSRYFQGSLAGLRRLLGS